MPDLKNWLQAQTTALIALLVAFIFDRLFYGMAVGVNLPLFVLLISALLVHDLGWTALSMPARWAMLGTGIAAAMTVVHGSIIAPVMTVIGTIGFTALAHHRALRSLPFAWLQGLANYLALPAAAVQGVGDAVPERSAARTSWRWTRLSVLPILALIVFFQLYRVGNPRFEHLTAGFLDGLWDAISALIEKVLTAHTLFFLFALILSAGLLKRYAPDLVLQWERSCGDGLMRLRRKRPHWLSPLPMNALDRERRKGMLLLILVNLLLLVVNAIDINWVWFGFTVPEGFSLKQFVHEGTYALIFSILLSIAVVLWLFRGNQNFYVRSTGLRRLALLWVAQNGVLAISVFLRNWHYISFHGLAYKRVGVIVFLVLVLVGLITLFLKVRDRKSLYYLLRVNTWAAFALLVGLTTIDWDSFIVRVNLRHANPGEIDIDNYLAMSDKVLPLLYANIDLVEQQMERHKHNRVRWVEHLEPMAFRSALDAKRDAFAERLATQHWQEWTWADARTFHALYPEAQRVDG
ncbi:MAG: DUF4173 domain-containing protein [Flavobacteriales bacterium]|nr:DUF4173 domain-containing protein [Flavobacteriales bacterium]